MIFQGTDDGTQAMVPAYPFSLSITRIADLPPGRHCECVLHEETVVVCDVYEATVIASRLLRLYGGDGYSVRRSEEVLIV
jgi:hypothetical protein